MIEQIKNDPISAMQAEVKSNTTLFEGVSFFPDDQVLYHEACDEEFMALDNPNGDDTDFSDILDAVLKHLAECEAEDDEEDAEGYDYDDEDDEDDEEE